MRFGVAHKIATYLLVGSAFAALALGSGVSPIISIVAAICLIASWWWEPPLISFERWAVAWAIGSVLVLGYDTIWGVKGRPDWITQARTYPFVNACSDGLVKMIGERRKAAADAADSSVAGN